MISDLNRKLTVFLAAALFACASCSLLRVEKPLRTQPGDWTMYGGDSSRTNVSHADVRPPLTRVWEYDAGGGFGSSSATVVDSVIFLGTLKGEVHAIDIRTGKGLGAHDFGSAIVGTPVVENNTVYVTLAHAQESLIAYDFTEGKSVWQAKLGDIESSPLVVQDKLIVTTVRGKLVCVNKNTGETLWKFEIPSSDHVVMTHSSPATDGHVVVFGADNGSVYAVDIQSGSLTWQARTGATISASPSVHRGVVYVGSQDHFLYAFELQSGRQMWKQDLGASIFSSQAVDDRHVYVGTPGRVLFCLKAEDGTILWRYTAMSVFSAAPLVVNDVVIAGCLDKTMYVLDANTGEKRWEYKTTGRIKTTPVAWRNYLLVLSEDEAVIAFTSATVE